MELVCAAEGCAWARNDVAKLMVDSPSDQMSLVRFRARTFLTIWSQPSATRITGEVPINVEDSSVYSILYML